MSEIRARRSTRLLAVAAGLAYASIILLFGLKDFLPTIGSVAAIVVLTAGFAWIAHHLLNVLIIPGLSVFSYTGRVVLLLVAGIIGVLLFISSPLPMPSNPLIERLFPEAIASALSWATGMLAVMVAGSFLVLVVLLAVVGTHQPLYPRFPVVAGFIITYLVAGLAVYGDYGLSTDEPLQRNHGFVALKYVLTQVSPSLPDETLNAYPELEAYEHKNYGMGFQLPLAAFEYANGISSFPDVWFVRHYFTFLFFFCGSLAFYRLATEKYEHWLFGLAGLTFLILTPRIFAEAFYNVKDTTFLAAFSLALYFGFRYWREPTIGIGVAFGMSLALAANIRIVALGLLGLVVAMVIIDLIHTRKRPRLLPALLSGVAFLAVYLLLAPASWSNPGQFLLSTLERFSDYDTWNDSIMYLGEYIPGQTVPWHFIPVWMLITIPLSYTALFAVGIVSLCAALVRKPLAVFYQIGLRENIVFLLLLVVPVTLAIVLRSTLYTGWRHFTFVYVPFLLLALRGLQVLVHQLAKSRIRSRLVVTVVLVIGLYQFHILAWMIHNHPYQNVYFNSAANILGGRHHFERDYWRLSVRQGLEHILATDTRDDIVVHSINRFISLRDTILPPAEQSRIRIARRMEDDVNYLIDPHWAPPTHYDVPALPVYYAIEVDGLPILTIYKVK
jgi:hypothetical protein